MTAIIILIVLAALGGIAFHISRQPDEFRVTRSAKINASPDAIYPWMSSPKKAAEWSPWVRMEPDANYQYEGPDAGVGAITTWNGKKTGAGKLTVTDAVPNERVKMSLQFYKPMACINTVEYVLTPANDGTNVTWVMFGPNNLMGKLMSIFMNCQKMCETQFDQGLQNLKETVEGK